MSDIKKIEVTVRSVIDELTTEGLITGEPEINIITAEGRLICGEGVRTVEYLEKSEEAEVLCRLGIKDGGVYLKRSGAVECEIEFREGKTVKTLYSVPPYSFDMTVNTKKIREKHSDTEGEIRLIYTMNVGGRDAGTNMKITYKVK